MPSYMVRLTDKKLKEAKIKAISENRHLSEIVRALLELWLSGKIKIAKEK